MNIEHTFTTEAAAKVARRAHINAGASVSLIGYDPTRNVYAYDVLSHNHPERTTPMFNVYLINSHNETLALTDDIDAPHVAHFESTGALLDYIAQSVGTTGYRVNDDGWTVTPHVVTSYEVRDGRFDITDQVPAALAYRAERSNQ